jgi:hypothetical protein
LGGEFGDWPKKGVRSVDQLSGRGGYIHHIHKESLQERRTVYYACRMVSTQKVDDMAYEDLNPVHISFILTSHPDEKPIRRVKLCDTETHEIFDDLLELTLVYIPTVLKTYDKTSDLYIFARFFRITSQIEAEWIWIPFVQLSLFYRLQRIPYGPRDIRAGRMCAVAVIYTERTPLRRRGTRNVWDTTA